MKLIELIAILIPVFAFIAAIRIRGIDDSDLLTLILSVIIFVLLFFEIVIFVEQYKDYPITIQDFLIGFIYFSTVCLTIYLFRIFPKKLYLWIIWSLLISSCIIITFEII